MSDADSRKLISPLLQLAVVAIMAVPTYNKLAGDITAIELFDDLGLGAYGRIATGIVELFIMVCMFIPRIVWVGALLGMGTMTGAILSHIYLGKYALDYGGGSDHGGTMAMGILALFCCVALIALNETCIPILRDLRKKDLSEYDLSDDES